MIDKRYMLLHALAVFCSTLPRRRKCTHESRGFVNAIHTQKFPESLDGIEPPLSSSDVDTRFSVNDKGPIASDSTSVDSRLKRSWSRQQARYGIIAVARPKASPDDLSLSFSEGGRGGEANLQKESLFSNLTAVLQHELVCSAGFWRILCYPKIFVSSRILGELNWLLRIEVYYCREVVIEVILGARRRFTIFIFVEGAEGSR
jgi:hypothetical protein